MSNIPKNIQCHCTCKAFKYRRRYFINTFGQKVIRIFYRCESCWSRLVKDYIPELDGQEVSVLDLLKQIKK